MIIRDPGVKKSVGIFKGIIQPERENEDADRREKYNYGS